MKLVYKGRYRTSSSLPNREHEKNAVKIKEIENFDQLINLCSMIIMLYTFSFFMMVKNISIKDVLDSFFTISILSLLVMIPHEILHAVFFKDNVYLYHNLSSGTMFVIGTESMPKLRYIFMSIFPNLILGFIPYLLGFIFSNLTLCGLFGALSIGMGAGDYYNIYNVFKQVPKDGQIYMYKTDTYWFLPK